MRLAALSGLLVVCLGVAYGQSVQGVVTGTVFDSSGGVLPKAAVALTNVGTSISQSEITANDGAFRFNLVPPGKYTVVVKAPGFTEKQIRDVVVNASQVTPVNVTLSVSGATQTVEVQAQETLVQTATSRTRHHRRRHLHHQHPIVVPQRVRPRVPGAHRHPGHGPQARVRRLPPVRHGLPAQRRRQQRQLLGRLPPTSSPRWNPWPSSPCSLTA